MPAGGRCRAGLGLSWLQGAGLRVRGKQPLVGRGASKLAVLSRGPPGDPHKGNSETDLLAGVGAADPHCRRGD